MTIDFRKAQADDIDEIFSLVKSAIKCMCDDGIKQWDEIYPQRFDIEDDLADDYLFVGTCGGRIAIVFTVNQWTDEQYINGRWQFPDKPYYVIHRLCVNPDFQHKGVAEMTMKHIEGEVIKLGGMAIRLDVFSQNPYALRLYEKCGYEKVGDAKWRKGNFYLMEKYL